jgi:cyclase
MRNLLGLLAVLTAGLQAQTSEIQVLPVRGNVFMMVGAGANITLSVGSEGVLMVDTGLAQMSAGVIAAIDRVNREVATRGLPLASSAPTKPIRLIIDTTDDPDHAGGNGAMAKAGKTFTGGNVTGNEPDIGSEAQIYAFESILMRMTAAPKTGAKPVAYEDFPTDTYTVDQMYLSHYFNGEAVQLFHQAGAHTDGDTMVWFRGSDVLSTGDIFRTDIYPVIELDKGGHVQGVIDGLNHILQIAVPEFRLEGGTMIIPGHGRLCDSADVAYYRDMVTILRDRIQDAVKRGLTLQQTKDAGLTRDYDRRYGSPDAFIEAVYQDLSPKKQVAAK